MSALVSFRAKVTPPYLYQKIVVFKIFMDRYGRLLATATREFHPGMVLMPPLSLPTTLLTLGL
jgi:hypothetical protein